VRIHIVDGYVVLPLSIEKGDIEIEDGRITAIGRLTGDPLALHIDANGKYVLPGFIDIHANGIAGFDLTNGVFDVSRRKFRREAHIYVRGLEKALKAFAHTGTTLVALTLLEGPMKRLTQVLGHIASYLENDITVFNDMFYGAYVEGVFMKEKQFSGAHNPRYFNKPSVHLFEQLQKAAGGNIRIVNVVPEWGKAALALIKHLRGQGIVCCVGHSGATGDQYRAAIEKGSTLAIHVMNGPSSSSSKPFHGGGVLEVLLQSDDVYAEIIADGYHVDKSYVMDIVGRKGIDKCAIITDSMFVSQMRGVREFELLGIRGKASRAGKYLHIVGRDEALFGSVLTMDQAFQNVMNWFMTPLPGVWNRIHEPCTFEEALMKTSRLCSASPAEVLGVYEPSDRRLRSNLSFGTGDITVGKRADLVVLDICRDRHPFAVNVQSIIVNGRLIPKAERDSHVRDL
jgi:N-acetylglucosamine-6-phosphate deacetylase